MKMRVFTIEDGAAREGTAVEKLALKGAGIEIPAIIVGEEGRGRQRGVLPVQLTDSQYKEWQEKGRVEIKSAEVGTTKAEKPKLLVREADTNEKIIVVFRTKIGFRGSNSHTGDRTREVWTLDSFFSSEAKVVGLPDQPEYDRATVETYSPRIMKARGWDKEERKWDAGFEHHLEYASFPGEIIVEGTIAQGTAGRMGSGKQLVAVMPKGVVFRTGYGGRLYGRPSEHFFLWTGELFLSVTWEERAQTDLF